MFASCGKEPIEKKLKAYTGEKKPEPVRLVILCVG